MTFFAAPAALAILQQGGGIPLPALLFQMAALFAIFYFLFIRPQQKQRKTHEARLLELKRGDSIVTAGGIVGEIVEMKKSTKDGQPVATLEDRVTIKSGETRIIVERGRIARVVPPSVSSAS